MREIIRARNSGFCFGVERAVNQAFTIKREKGRTYTLGPLIHNKDVTDRLRQETILEISAEEIESLNPEDTVIIRTHGVAMEVYDALRAKGVEIIDLTCPYVINIQKKVSEHYRKGYQIVILGDSGHPEVIGINGWCDNTAYITSTGEIHIPLKRKVCVVSQTTEKQSNWLRLIGNIAEVSKEFVAFNTICKATEERQKSSEELSKEVDAMVVIGGKSSSNTRKLYEICKGNCEKTFLVENAAELSKIMVELEGAVKVGVTAGASTPEWIIKEAVGLL